MKKKRNAIAGGVALALLLLVACSPSAHIEKDKNTDFSRYRTYSWMKQETENGKKSRFSSLADQQIREAVNQQLKKEGWSEVRNNPDVLIGYDILVERTNRQTRNPVYTRPFTRVYYNPYTRRYGTIYFPARFLGYDNEVYTTREGTITLSLVDVRQDKTVWQGWSTSEVNSRNLTRKEIESGVRSIFRKFDIAKN